MRLTILLTLLLLLVIATMSCSKDPQQNSRKQLTVAAISGVEGEALKQAALDYEAQTGVHLSVTEFPYANLFDKEMIDLNARTGAYDLIMLDDPWFPTFASKQFLTELTPLLQKRGQNGPDSDFVSKVLVDGLPAGQDIFYRVRFDDMSESGIEISIIR